MRVAVLSDIHGVLPAVEAVLAEPDVRSVCGHTHMPFVRLVDRRLVVNPGSVGMPYGGPRAHWVLLTDDGTVIARRTHFDIDAARERIAAESTYPQAAEFADYYVRSRASDIEALRVFGPRDGRAATTEG